MTHILAKDSDFQVELFSPVAFDRYWPQIERMMDQVPHTWEDLTKDSIVTRAHNDTLQVWGVGDDFIRMVLFTQVATFSAGPVLQIIWGAGEGKIYEKAGDVVDATLDYFAKTQHCKRIDIIGRGGWEKPLSMRGFKKAAVVLSRTVIHNGMQ